ncbi:hypothetical protein VTH06DRAFT_44 [Thermothelomyces fergusii]
MIRLGLLTFHILLAVVPLVAYGQFYAPTGGDIYSVGDVMTIEYETDLEEYTIALWQLKQDGHSGIFGPVIYVNISDFDLEYSYAFYFWLTEGGEEDATSDHPDDLVSDIFFITEESGSTAGEGTPTITATTITTITATALPEPPRKGGGGGDLSVGAQVGIGVGVSVFGIVFIVCAVLLFRHLRKQQNLLVDLRQRILPPPPDHDDAPADAAITPKTKHDHDHGDPGPNPAELPENHLLHQPHLRPELDGKSEYCYAELDAGQEIPAARSGNSRPAGPGDG